MAKSDRFRKQHDELLALAGELAAELDESGLAKDATAARSALSRLSGKLIVHLTMEDAHLYPRLMESGDADIKNTAKNFIDEMGGIAKAFTAYTEKWPTAAAIEQDPSAFITETKGIYAALSKRIDQENNVLYPMMDQVA